MKASMMLNAEILGIFPGSNEIVKHLTKWLLALEIPGLRDQDRCVYEGMAPEVSPMRVHAWEKQHDR